MIENKPIYYSEKSHNYYFNSTNAFGGYYAQTVYGCEKLKGGEIKIDKNGRQYIMGIVERVKSKNDRYYYRCIGYVKPKEAAYETESEV